MSKVMCYSGQVKWKDHADSTPLILGEGDEVELVPVDGAEAGTDDQLLRKILQNEREDDKAAPTVGTASSREDGVVPGEFTIMPDAPLSVRIYAGSYFREVVLQEGQELTLPVTESNAVTAAFYGVKVAATEE